jgi:hypothetical protein
MTTPLRYLLVAVSVLLAHGCVSVPSSSNARSTVLLSVVLKDAVADELQPAGLVVGIDEQAGGAGGQQFAFGADTRIPGQYTAFLVRLDLPAGPHRLTHVSGVAGSGALAPRFDVLTDMPFDVKSGATRYLGHVELNPQPSMVLADAYESDLPKFLLAWPALRTPLHTPAIERGAPEGIVPLRVAARAPIAVESKSRGAAAKLDGSVAAALPATARVAFQNFLKSAYPRAFAVGAAGHSGTAVGGKDVIRRALQNCQRKQAESRDSGCQLFALDDTLISSMQR